MLPLAVVELGARLIEKLIPDPQAKAQAQLELVKLQQSGEFKELEERMGAIKMEAGSSDPWTSRARPSFMYVMYTLLLTALPVGLLYVYHPSEVKLFIEGFKLFLDSIPGELYALFGAGYLGYAHYRTSEKKSGKS